MFTRWKRRLSCVCLRRLEFCGWCAERRVLPKHLSVSRGYAANVAQPVILSDSLSSILYIVSHSSKSICDEFTALLPLLSQGMLHFVGVQWLPQYGTRTQLLILPQCNVEAWHSIPATACHKRGLVGYTCLLVWVPRCWWSCGWLWGRRFCKRVAAAMTPFTSPLCCGHCSHCSHCVSCVEHASQDDCECAGCVRKNGPINTRLSPILVKRFALC